MVDAAGMASVGLLTAAPAVKWGNSATPCSLPNGYGVRLKLAATKSQGRRFTTPGLRLRASLSDDVKKTTAGGKAEAGKAVGDTEKELKKGFSEAKTGVEKAEKDLEEKVGDVQTGVEAESAETKEKVATAVEDFKERVQDALDSEKA